MSNGRSVRRVMLLIVPVLFGLLGMHALVVPGAAPTHASPAVGIPATGHGLGEHRLTTSPVAAAERQGSGGHDGAVHLLHLCLAVLVVVGLTLLAAWSFLGRFRLPVSSMAVPLPAGGMPVQRPPPVRRRLAQLCVMRN